MKIGSRIAELHSEAGLFSASAFAVGPEKNILVCLERFEEFTYLSEFYSDYESHFRGEHSTVSRSEARSRDLPFIGNHVIDSGVAKYLFVFEGSLSAVDKLSITVLSHLWLTEDQATISGFCGNPGWWTSRDYLNIRNRLRLSPTIAADSYVVDAIRFNSDSDSTKLVHEEIRLLKPKIVVCVGRKARDIVGMKYFDQDTKFHHVRFPKYHNDNCIYDELSAILSNIDR